MYILSARYLIESPRWFLSQARTPEAESVLHYIARGLAQKNLLQISNTSVTLYSKVTV